MEKQRPPARLVEGIEKTTFNGKDYCPKMAAAAEIGGAVERGQEGEGEEQVLLHCGGWGSLRTGLVLVMVCALPGTARA